MSQAKVFIRVLTPRLAEGVRIVAVGSSPSLGGWNPLEALPMQRSGIPLWTAELPDDTPADVEFKFLAVRDDEVTWEDGENRTLANPGPLEFRGMPRWRAAGVAVPVFSLRSDDDFGCGDFTDLRLLVDWAERTGQQIIQILPVNDTTMTRTRRDSYPYNANSSFALHTLYLRPQLLGTPSNPAVAADFERRRRELQAAPAVDYPAVIAAKEEYARIIYKERGEKTLSNPEFAAFVGENAAWLLPYAAYSVLRDRFSTPDFRTWPDGLSSYSDAVPARLLLGEERSEMLYYMWLQFHLHLQLTDACNYARTRGIGVKGDIPIGISPDSVDAWQYPELFNLDSSAGAPPDDFAVDGQNWGFPTYNWQRMQDDDFRWWRRRLQHMSRYFDAFRIDHILGFFRIWEIPAGVSSGLLGHFSPALPLSPGEMLARFGFVFSADMAQPRDDNPTDLLFVPDPRKPGYFHPRILGYKTRAFAALPLAQQQAYSNLHEDFFYHRHNDFWAESALKKLPDLVDATPMLACAEDLGMIPACVPQVLQQLRILALEVQRMPKQYGRVLALPADYAWLNVATTSTHDMAPLRLWWSERPDQSRFYAAEATPEACRAVIAEHSASPAMLLILPIQDWLALSPGLRRHNPAEEQINVPANPRHYWQYRLHVPLEQLIADSALTADMRSLTSRR